MGNCGTLDVTEEPLNRGYMWRCMWLMTMAGICQLTFPRNEARGLAGRKLTQAEPRGWRGIVRQYELSCVVQESPTRHGVRKKKKKAEEKKRGE